MNLSGYCINLGLSYYNYSNKLLNTVKLLSNHPYSLNRYTCRDFPPHNSSTLMEPIKWNHNLIQ